MEGACVTVTVIVIGEAFRLYKAGAVLTQRFALSTKPRNKHISRGANTYRELLVFEESPNTSQPTGKSQSTSLTMNPFTYVLELLIRIILHPKTGVVIGSLGVVLIIGRELYKIFHSAQAFQEQQAANQAQIVAEPVPEPAEKSAKAQ